MSLDEIKKYGKCCITEEPLHTSAEINVVQLAYKATWKFPTHGNVITGQSGLAMAFVHDAAVSDQGQLIAPVRFAVECRGEELVYHPVEELEQEVLQTYTIGYDAGGEYIRCLRCQMTSYNKNDIANRYCGYCKKFHESIT